MEKDEAQAIMNRVLDKATAINARREKETQFMKAVDEVGDAFNAAANILKGELKTLTVVQALEAMAYIVQNSVEEVLKSITAKDARLERLTAEWEAKQAAEKAAIEKGVDKEPASV